MSHSLRQLQDFITSPSSDNGFIRLYGKDAVISQKNRYLQLLELGENKFEAITPFIISAPGRTELGGNHTDHQHGKVISAAVNLDCVAAVAPSDNMKVNLLSDQLQRPIALDLDNTSPRAAEEGQPESLIRGVAAACHKNGLKIKGFNGYLHSTCKPGTGLSSSAAFSVLTGAIFSVLNDITPNPVQLAHCAKFAENHYFGKPCGLMDQLSSALGTTLFINFLNPDQPQISPLTTTAFATSPYRMVIVDTGGSHVGLTKEYADITEEITRAAQILGKNFAGDLDMNSVLGQLGKIRKKAGDRATLRLIHIIQENMRVTKQVTALSENRFTDFLALVQASGVSSCRLLQNCSNPSNTKEQGILLALALTDEFCPQSVVRVHGGGFAGTIQAYIPEHELDRYQKMMGPIFGRDAVLPVRIGRPGICSLTKQGWSCPADGVALCAI